MGMFMSAGCVLCCTFLTSEKQLLVCCLESWYWYPSEPEPRGWSVFRLGWRCQLNVITNKFILIEYVNELWLLLSAELAKYIEEEVSVLCIPSCWSLTLNSQHSHQSGSQYGPKEGNWEEIAHEVSGKQEQILSGKAVGRSCETQKVSFTPL